VSIREELLAASVLPAGQPDRVQAERKARAAGQEVLTAFMALAAANDDLRSSLLSVSSVPGLDVRLLKLIPTETATPVNGHSNGHVNGHAHPNVGGTTTVRPPATARFTTTWGKAGAVLFFLAALTLVGWEIEDEWWPQRQIAVEQVPALVTTLAQTVSPEPEKLATFIKPVSSMDEAKRVLADHLKDRAGHRKSELPEPEPGYAIREVGEANAGEKRGLFGVYVGPNGSYRVYQFDGSSCRVPESFDQAGFHEGGNRIDVWRLSPSNVLLLRIHAMTLHLEGGCGK
jgi:hypothetical protein